MEKYIETKNEKRNIIKYVIYNMLYSSGSFIRTGAATTSLLLFLGITNQQLSFNTSIQSIIGLLSFLLASLFCDRFKSVKNLIAILTVLCGFSLVSLIIDAQTGYSPNVKFIIYVAGLSLSTIANNFFQSVYNKLPYEIFDLKKYGKISATGGYTTGILSTIVSIVLQICVVKFNLLSTMTIFYFVSAFFYVICTILCFSFAKYEGNPVQETTKDSISFKSLFNLTYFRKIIPAFVLQGLASAIFGLSIGFAVETGIFDSADQATIIFIMASAGCVIGAALYVIFEKKIKPMTLLIIVGITYSLSTMLLLVFKSNVVFCIIYFIFQVAVTIYSYPLYVSFYSCVPKNSLGKFFSLMNIIITIGTMISAYVVGLLMPYVHPLIFMIIGSISMLSSILLVAIYSAKYKLPEEEKEN